MDLQWAFCITLSFYVSCWKSVLVDGVIKWSIFNEVWLFHILRAPFMGSLEAYYHSVTRQGEICSSLSGPCCIRTPELPSKFLSRAKCRESVVWKQTFYVHDRGQETSQRMMSVRCGVGNSAKSASTLCVTLHWGIGGSALCWERVLRPTRGWITYQRRPQNPLW